MQLKTKYGNVADVLTAQFCYHSVTENNWEIPSPDLKSRNRGASDEQ